MSDTKEVLTIEDENGEKDHFKIKYLTTNRKKGKDLNILADELGVQPFEILLRAAAGDWRGLGYSSGFETKYTANGTAYEVDILPIDLRIAAAKEAAQYLHPKKRAIEHSGSDELPPIRVEGTTDAIIERVRSRKV